MCKLQEPPFEMDIVVSSNVEDIMALAPKPKEKKTKKPKKTTGMEVVESVQEASEPQLIVNENAQTAFENVALPAYEEMMFQDWLACGNVEPPLDLPADLEQVALQEYLLDASKPLHTHFVLPHQGKRSTCPVYFGNADNKQTVLNTICNEMHAKIQQQWGTFACHCGLVPTLKLSQTSRNQNKVFLCCPKTREARCGYFQWIHQSPKPNYVPKAATPSALKKRLNEMVQERLQKRPKVQEGGFKFP